MATNEGTVRRAGKKRAGGTPDTQAQFFLLLAAVGIAGSIGYAAQFDRSTFLKVASFSVVVAGAAGLSAGLLGFVFGLPTTIYREREADDRPQYRANNSLEQISDWVTKIIVGIGLVQLGRVSGALAALGEALRPGFAPVGAGRDALNTAGAFGVALVIYFGLGGFLAAFLWARLSLPGQFRLADIVDELEKRRRTQEEHDAWALTLVERALAQEPGSAPPTQAQLEDALRDASAPVLVQVFNRARASRRESERAGDRDAVGRTVPVFSALTAIDKEDRFHRNYAQLGYALKTIAEGNHYEDAIAALTRAIEIRGDWRTRGFILYELNRALCRIESEPSFRKGERSSDEVKKVVLDDLNVAGNSGSLRRSMTTNKTIRRWLELNEVHLN